MSESDIAGGEAVLPGEERNPGGMTLGGIVKLRETQSVGGKAVKVGCFNFASITADVREAEVVDHDDDNIGLFS